MTLRLLTALLFLGALTACAPPEIVSEDAPKIRPAKLITVVQASTSRSLSFPAVIEAENSAQLTFQVSGQITTLTVLEGDEVTQGQVIARVEQRDYQNALAQAQAQFDNAETEYRRAQRLVDQDAISRSILETRRTNRDVAKAALDTANKTSGDTILRAPFSGVISQVFVKRYQNIQAKEAIANLQSREVVAIINAPADIVARTPQFTPTNTRVVLDAALNTALPAIFKEASAQADANTQTYKASFSFSTPETLIILPGMTARVDTDFQFNGDADIVPTGIGVPVGAVVARGDKRFVWRVDPDTMKISSAPITTGSGMSETEIIVTRGLQNGDLIVAAGGTFLNEGTTVRAWTAN